MDGHLSCFHFGVIMNNAAINICVQVFVWAYVFISLKDTLRNRVAGSYGSSGTSMVVQMAGSSTGKESICNAGDPGLIPGSERFPGEQIGYPRRYSWLENSMPRGAWLATVHGDAKSRTWLSSFHFYMVALGFPGGSVVKESCNSGNVGSIPGSERSPGGGNGNPLEYSCLENPMDRGAWQAIVQRVAESDTTEWLCAWVRTRAHTHTHTHTHFV